MIAIISEAKPFIEGKGTFAQQATWYESLVLLDILRCRAYQLPDEALRNAQKQVEIARASGNRRLIGRAVSIVGFVHLLRDELDAAKQCFLDGLKDVEAVGDVETQSINLNYMTLIGRKRSDTTLVREWASKTLLLARKANILYYQSTALGSLAWVELQENNEEQAGSYLREALAIQKKAPSSVPWFMVLGPALAVEIRAKNWDTATEYVKTLLQPAQQRLPDEIQSTLEQAVACWEAGDQESTGAMLVKSIELMKEKQLGYV